MNLTLALFTLGILITTLLSVVAWIGNGMIVQLKAIATSLQRVEIDLGILNHDHANLKEDVKDVKERVKTLERA
jgi:hypothetical protein